MSLVATRQYRNTYIHACVRVCVCVCVCIHAYLYALCEHSHSSSKRRIQVAFSCSTVYKHVANHDQKIQHKLFPMLVEAVGDVARDLRKVEYLDVWPPAVYCFVDVFEEERGVRVSVLV